MEVNAAEPRQSHTGQRQPHAPALPASLLTPFLFLGLVHSSLLSDFTISKSLLWSQC